MAIFLLPQGAVQGGGVQVFLLEAKSRPATSSSSCAGSARRRPSAGTKKKDKLERVKAKKMVEIFIFLVSEDKEDLRGSLGDWFTRRGTKEQV